MKRFPLYTLAAAVALGLGALFTGCDAADLGTAQATAQAADADGEALLRGLLFGEGEAAEALPEVWGTPRAEQALAALTPEMRDRQDALIATLDEADPAFFDRFEREMTSGDLQRVDASLRSATAFVEASAPPAMSSKARAEEGIIVYYVTQLVCGHHLVCPPPYFWPISFVAPQTGNDVFLGEDEGATLRREELVGRLAERLHR